MNFPDLLQGLLSLLFPSTSLRTRFTWLVITVASACSLIGGVLVYQVSYRQSMASASDTLDGLVSAIEHTAAIGAYSGDEVLLKEIADGLARHAIVAQVLIKTDRHAVTAGYTVSLLDDDKPSTAPLQTVRALVSPFDTHDRVGTLTVTAAQQQINHEANDRARWLALVMGGQILLIATLLHAAATHWVTRPLERLSNTLGAIEPGTPARLGVPSHHVHDEIGSLIASANGLLMGVESALQRERDLRQQVEAMEARYRHIFDASSAGIFVLDKTGQMISANPAVMNLLQNAPTGPDFITRVFAQPSLVHNMLKKARQDAASTSADLQLRTFDGEKPRWVHCLISVHTSIHHGERTHGELIEGMLYDVTERRHRENMAHHQAEHDALTGLPNRKVYETRVDQWLNPMGGYKRVLLMFIDLDGFKQVNDTHGHRVGDEVLKICASRIAECLAPGPEFAARLGGDEFVVAMPDVTDEAMTRTAQAILFTVSQPIATLSGPVHNIRIGASIGMAYSPRHGITRGILTHWADTAMYEVKRTGKNAMAMAVITPNSDSDFSPFEGLSAEVPSSGTGSALAFLAEPTADSTGARAARFTARGTGR